MRPTVLSSSRKAALYAMLMLAITGPVAAQEPGDKSAAENSPGQDTVVDVPADAIDWSALNISSDLPQKTLRVPKATGNGGPNKDASSWSRDNRPDGSSAVAVKQAVTPVPNTFVGADFNVAKPAPLSLSELPPDTIVSGARPQNSSGSAWASITSSGVPYLFDKASVEARLDPSVDQTKVGTTLSKSVPMWNDRLSLTLLGGYRLTEQAPLPLTGILGGPTRTVEVERTAKFDINQTGTSFVAGETMSSTDDRWLKQIGAEQKVFGDVSVKGAVSETAAGPSSKSLSATFKKTW